MSLRSSSLRNVTSNGVRPYPTQPIAILVTVVCLVCLFSILSLFDWFRSLFRIKACADCVNRSDDMLLSRRQRRHRDNLRLMHILPGISESGEGPAIELCDLS